jgi:hypothetical protein
MTATTTTTSGGGTVTTAAQLRENSFAGGPAPLTGKLKSQFKNI